jgi:biotin carboxyl carrier protein
VLGEIDPVIYKAQYDQAVAKKAQDEAQLANQRLDLARYQQLAASNAGSKQQADTQRAVVAQQEALVKADQAAIDNAQATLGYTKIIAPLSGRAGLRQVDQGNIIHASDATGLVIITQLQPIAVQFSLPQQQIVRVNAAAAKGALAVDVFGNDGVTVIDTGNAEGHRQPGRSDHRHAEAQGRISQRQFSALAGAVRQCAAQGRNAFAGDRGADLGGAARSGRNVQLRHRRRRHRDGQAGRR